MATATRPARAGIVLRWPLGLALVSWRYMWRTTPLHRSEETGNATDLPQRARPAWTAFIVRMPGPWDGPVRVVHRDPTSFRLATLDGHLEAGEIEFRAAPDGDVLRFEIESWARAGDRLADLLYNRLRLAKEIQLNMWSHFCVRTAALAGGRLSGGVTIRTRKVDWPPPGTGTRDLNGQAAGPVRR
ncbi:MAG: DUF1990 family protein [Streptosporangiaceae bacterium]